jgi:predicted transglutaminase-like cysteine proteinase
MKIELLTALVMLSACQTTTSPPMELVHINEAVNSIPYVSDPPGGERITHDEFIKRGGDCEEYVFLKEALLKHNTKYTMNYILEPDPPHIKLNVCSAIDGCWILDNIPPYIYRESE